MFRRRTFVAKPLATLLPLAAPALLAALASAWAGPPRVKTPPTPPPDPAGLAKDVQTLLQQNCLGCHGAEGTRLSGLDLTSRTSALKGGSRGTSLVPGHAADSLLYRLVSGARAPQMPPGGRLSSSDIALIRRWIDSGAEWPSAAPIANARKQVWWSFRPPVEPQIPSFPKEPWVKNPIDAFVLKGLRTARLSPSPAAPRAVLIRRAYLDLIGLPPSPDRVREFEQDTSPDAWAKVVDRLLSSPRYGERWGRHWLDLVRYADSGGFEGDADRPLIWRYRDYVIDSFNSDKPYPTFLREQIAGDEIPERSNETLIATGYLACGQKNLVAMDRDERRRSDELDDLVSTTGASMLGLTVGCARCHDHKYDPIPTTDYYRLQAVFAPTIGREVDVPTPQERADAERRNAPVEKDIAALRTQSDALKSLKDDASKKRLAAINDQIKAESGHLVALPKAMEVTDGGKDFPAVFVSLRGDPYQHGSQVQPGFLSALPGGSANIASPADPRATTTGRRLALANWLTDSGNPLVSRVWINRVWRQHFGRGIVNTPSNFGISGELPSHPELLDWLTLQFQHEGGRLKPIHRMILMSSTYQQSSVIRPGPNAADPQDHLYWRMPVRRIEAEAIRDSILAVSGAINLTQGGPPVYPPVDPSLRSTTFQGWNWPDNTEDSPKTWRRSVYVKVKRSLLLPQLEVFDCPEISAAVAQRNISTTPTQALTLLNDSLIRKQAQIFAERLRREAGPKPEKQIERAYELALGRPPTPTEKSLSLTFLTESADNPNALVDFAHAMFNLNEFVYAP